MLTALEEAPSLVSGTHMRVHNSNSSSKGSDAAFCSNLHRHYPRIPKFSHRHRHIHLKNESEGQGLVVQKQRTCLVYLKTRPQFLFLCSRQGLNPNLDLDVDILELTL